jgi:hypothetical protein
MPLAEEFDLVVLSVGMEVTPEMTELAGDLGVELNPYQFAVTDGFSPVSTSRRGVYTCGLFQGPKDIPSAITEASAAIDLADSRGTQIRPRPVPPELDLEDAPPRVDIIRRHPVASFFLVDPHFGDRHGIIHSLLETLTEARVSPLAISCSVSSVSAVVPAEDLLASLKALGTRFQIPNPESPDRVKS